MHSGLRILGALAVAGALACSSGDGGSDTPTSPPPPPPPPGASEAWGAVGCSQTQGALRGYQLVGGTKGWPRSALVGYDDGEIHVWANLNDERWETFQQALDQYGADFIWFEVCVTDRVSPTASSDDLAAAETIVSEIKRRAPGRDVYVSALADYVGIECPKTGPGGTAVAQAVADHLVAIGEGQVGPLMGPLDANTTTEDHCHANEQGQILQGQQLLDFFG